MRQEVLIDAIIALGIAIAVIVLSPGLAITGLIALAAIVICLASFAIGRVRRRRRKSKAAAARRERRRPPPAGPSSRGSAQRARTVKKSRL